MSAGETQGKAAKTKDAQGESGTEVGGGGDDDDGGQGDLLEDMSEEGDGEEEEGALKSKSSDEAGPETVIEKSEKR